MILQRKESFCSIIILLFKKLFQRWSFQEFYHSIIRMLCKPIHNTIFCFQKLLWYILVPLYIIIYFWKVNKLLTYSINITITKITKIIFKKDIPFLVFSLPKSPSVVLSKAMFFLLILFFSCCHLGFYYLFSKDII